MSAISLQARVSTRSVKKLEKPRPLKLNTSQSRHAENRLSMGGLSGEGLPSLSFILLNILKLTLFFILFCYFLSCMFYLLVDEVMALADTVCQHILNGNCDRALQSNVVNLSSSLKLYGQQLETIYKGN